MEEKRINICELLGTKTADDDKKGERVFCEIMNMTRDDGSKIVLDFKEIELVNTAFLNNAVGQLLDKSKYDITKNNVKITNMEPAMIDLLKETLNVAKERYKEVKSEA